MSSSDRPTFYIYESDNGWRKTDKALTDAINAHIFGTGKLDTAGRSFYPQWPEPDYKSDTRPAWRVNADGIMVVRTYWRIRDHEPAKHGTRCAKLADKRCGFRCAHRLAWNADKKLWTLVDTINEATAEEARKLSRF